MTFTIEIEDQLASELQRQTSVLGQTPEAYVEDAVRQRMSRDAQDIVLDQAIERIRRAGGSLGRDGKPWHEFIHEGHRY